MKLFIYAVLITIALSFLTSAQTQNPAKTESDLQVGAENGGTLDLSDEDLIREIIFRRILEPWRSNSDKTLKVYYLSIDGGKDPSKNLLKKFTDYEVPIKKVSESFISPIGGDTILNKVSKEQGVLFSVSKLDWKSKNEVRVNAGSYIGNLGSDGCTYTLKREKGKWKIISVKDCFIS